MDAKQPTPRIADADLLTFSERLQHSIQLYFALSRRLARVRLGFEDAPPWEIETAMVESFALHTRGLADFFFTKEQRLKPQAQYDALALHYFSPPERWAEIVGDPGRWLRQTYQRSGRGIAHIDRFGQLVAHLNYHDPPTSELARGWPVMQLSYDVGLAVLRFVVNVEARKVADGFRENVVREIPAAARIDKPGLPLMTWTRPSLRLRPNE